MVTDINDFGNDLLDPSIDLMGKNARELVYEHLVLTDKALSGMIMKPTFFDEVEVIRANGERLNLKIDSISYFDDEGHFSGVYILFNEIIDEQKLITKLQRRDELLRATADVNHILLSNDDVNEALYKAFKLIGEATDVDRVYVFENYFDEDTKTVFCTQRLEWAKDSIVPQIDNEDLKAVPLELGIPRWMYTLSKGDAINGLVKNFPLEEREILEPQDIISILVVPITIKGKFWGFVGFDNCTSEYKWSEHEVAVLTSLASNMGLTFERLRTNKELEKSQEMFRQIADTIDEVFYVRNADMSVEYMNNAFQKMFGYSVDMIKENPELFTQNVHSDDLGKLKESLMKDEDSFELKYIDPDNGSTRYIANKRFPVYDDQGKVIRYIGVMNDITRIKQAQIKLEESLEAEKELNDLKNRFISMISHEIRTPVTAIVSSSELMNTYANRLDENKKAELNKRVLSASQKIIDLLEEVLLMGKAEAGKLSAEFEWINLRELVEEIIEDQKQTRLKDREVQLSVEVSNPSFKTDQRLFRHILNNLLDNAGKYSPDDTRIRISFSEYEQNLIFIVRDEGMGIREKDQKKIFEPFYRTKDVFEIEGTGLGMTIVKRSVEALGGSIELDSEIGKGTTFTISIPLGE